MKRAALALILMLGACAITPAGSFRDQSAPISSTTRAHAVDMAGVWFVRAGFTKVGTSLRAAQVEFHAGPSGQIAMLVTPEAGTIAVTETLPGRYLSADGSEYWVLWVDADFRTAAIGTPSGGFGWIIDRAKAGGADRLTAAREILQWVGYDMSQLVEIL